MDDLEPNDLIKDLLKQLGDSGAIHRAVGESFQGDPGEFAASVTPELVTIVGYLSDVRSDGDVTWRQFYLDLNLRRCLWIDDSQIVAHRKLNDPELKPGVRDMIWVKKDAPIVVADASAAAEVQFLTGDFTRAGDVDVDAIAGAVHPATGKFCGRSPACCAGRTPR
jgi:hypothetical protein